MRYAVAYLNMFDNEITQQVVEATSELGAMKDYLYETRVSENTPDEERNEIIDALESVTTLDDLYGTILTDEEVISALLVD